MSDETYVTEIGTLQYAFLNKPRDYKGDGNFRYSCNLLLEGQAAADLENLIDQKLEEICREHKTRKIGFRSYEPAVDENGKELPGTTKIKFANNATVKTKSGKEIDKKPAFFDVDGNPLTGDGEPQIGSGTTARIEFTIYGYKHATGASVKLQPIAVQIVDLVEWNGSGAQVTPGTKFGPVRKQQQQQASTTSRRPTSR